MKKGYAKEDKTTKKASDKNTNTVKGYALSKYPEDLPTLHLNEKNLPAIKNWKIGEKYKLELEVELTSLSKDTYGSQDSGLHACFKIANTKNSVTEDTDEDD